MNNKLAKLSLVWSWECPDCQKNNLSNVEIHQPASEVDDINEFLSFIQNANLENIELNDFSGAHLLKQINNADDDIQDVPMLAYPESVVCTHCGITYNVDNEFVNADENKNEDGHNDSGKNIIEFS